MTGMIDRALRFIAAHRFLLTMTAYLVVACAVGLLAVAVGSLAGIVSGVVVCCAGGLGAAWFVPWLIGEDQP